MKSQKGSACSNLPQMRNISVPSSVTEYHHGRKEEGGRGGRRKDTEIRKGVGGMLLNFAVTKNEGEGRGSERRRRGGGGDCVRS